MSKSVRYFIRQPHHALSAMLDFGMEFEDKQGRPLLPLIKDGAIFHVDKEKTGGWTFIEPHTGSCYIRPSSEYLLSTRLQDVASFYWTTRERRMYGIVIDFEPLTLAVSGINWRGEMPDFRIEKRDGLSFPPVETEIAEIEG